MKDDPIAFIQNITEAVFVGLYMVFSIEITKLILKTIQSGDTDFFYTLIALYAVVSIILMGARFMINHWGWARISMG